MVNERQKEEKERATRSCCPLKSKRTMCAIQFMTKANQMLLLHQIVHVEERGQSQRRELTALYWGSLLSPWLQLTVKHLVRAGLEKKAVLE